MAVPIVPLLLAAALAATAPPDGSPLERDGSRAAPLADDAQQPSTPAPTPEAPAHPTAEAAAQATRATKSEWFALPVLFWLPETKLGGGASGGFHFDLDGAARPSSLFGAAVYTLGGQGSIDVATDLYGRSGVLFSARTRAVIFPDLYFGLGPDAPSSAEEKFTRRSLELVATLEFPIPGVPGLRAGPRVDLRAEDITNRQAGGQLAAGAVEGASGFSAAAFGGSITLDTRDSTFWTTRGGLAQAWYVYAPAALGRNDGFGRGVLELRYFTPLGRGIVLGWQGYGEADHGKPPFTLLPKLGSTRFLRGIREGRYRDRVDWATQLELRVPVWWRFSAATFMAVGNVAPSIDALTLRDPKLAGGAGLRFRLTDAGANIRVDGAVSKFGPEVYVLVLEAF